MWPVHKYMHAEATQYFKDSGGSNPNFAIPSIVRKHYYRSYSQFSNCFDFNTFSQAISCRENLLQLPYYLDSNFCPNKLITGWRQIIYTWSKLKDRDFCHALNVKFILASVIALISSWHNLPTHSSHCFSSGSPTFCLFK